jgi:hypothetical protein
MTGDGPRYGELSLLHTAKIIDIIL